jgi:hypothetical protein
MLRNFPNKRLYLWKTRVNKTKLTTLGKFSQQKDWIFEIPTKKITHYFLQIFPQVQITWVRLFLTAPLPIRSVQNSARIFAQICNDEIAGPHHYRIESL